MKNKKILFLALVFLISGLRAGEKPEQEPVADPAAPKAKVGRALLEMGINFSVSAINYWQKYSMFIEDWQFTLTWKDQKRKFFTSEGLRLDSNNLRLNWTHAWSGALYYNWARSNHLGILPSFLFSAGGSLLWEYVAEWREISSINDNIFTSAGGPAIGEPLFQIAGHFRSRPGLANRIACLLVDPVLGINDFIDSRHRAPRVPRRDWSDFRISLGGKQGPVAASDGHSSHGAFDLDMRLVTLPGYGRPGTASGFARQPLDNEYRVFFSFNERQMEEFYMRTRCVLQGWWRKNVRLDADGLPRGYEYWLGPVISWDYFHKKAIAPYDGNELGMTDPWFERERPTRYTDKHSSLRLLGPAFNLTAYAGGWTTRLDLEASGDFSMVNSLAYNGYTAGNDPWGVKTTLHNWGYYYALGYTLSGRLDVRTGQVRARAGIRYQRFHSIQGLDRFQDDLLDDSRLSDSLLAYSAGVSAAIPRTPLFLSLNLEGLGRHGRFHESSAKSHELRFFYSLGVRF